MKRNLIVLLLASLLPLIATAQRSDTLTCGYNHNLNCGQLIAPTTLVTAGAIITATPTFHQQLDFSLRDWVQNPPHDRWEIENVVQYVPGASVLLLKACGLQSRHNWRDLTSLGIGTVAILVGITQSMKYCTHVERPYGGVYTSFPSGHTATAFAGAEVLRREYGEEYPGVAIAGYTVAAGVGALRIYNNRHWASDVLAGAGIGILSASIMYWIAPYLRF